MGNAVGDLSYRYRFSLGSMRFMPGIVGIVGGCRTHGRSSLGHLASFDDALSYRWHDRFGHLSGLSVKAKLGLAALRKLIT